MPVPGFRGVAGADFAMAATPRVAMVEGSECHESRSVHNRLVVATAKIQKVVAMEARECAEDTQECITGRCIPSKPHHNG